MLPIKAELPLGNNVAAMKYVSLSLQRSGQHAIINWLGEQSRDLVHFNHCRFERRGYTNWVSPINHRVIHYKPDGKRDSGIQDRAGMIEFLSSVDAYNRILYSFEDYDLEDSVLCKYIRVSEPVIILILRDPYNWLASSIKHEKSSKALLASKKIYLIKYLEQVLGVKDYLKMPYVDINYNRWVMEAGYREAVCSRLGMNFSVAADKSVMDIQEFGGGSSFDGTKALGGELHSRIFERWKQYSSNAFYRGLLDDKYLEDLAKDYFKLESPL